METLVGALVAIWIVLCILVGVFLSAACLGSLCCIFSPPENTSRGEAFGGFIFCAVIAALCFTHVWWLMTKDTQTPETPETRDILLTVPQESSVNAQVISGNNTVNLQNL